MSDIRLFRRSGSEEITMYDNYKSKKIPSPVEAAEAIQKCTKGQCGSAYDSRFEKENPVLCYRTDKKLKWNNYEFIDTTDPSNYIWIYSHDNTSALPTEIRFVSYWDFSAYYVCNANLLVNGHIDISRVNKSTHVDPFSIEFHDIYYKCPYVEYPFKYHYMGIPVLNENSSSKLDDIIKRYNELKEELTTLKDIIKLNAK